MGLTSVVTSMVTVLLLLAAGVFILLGICLWWAFDAAWCRRWQLVEYALGVNPYSLLPNTYDAEELGIVRIEPDVYEGGGSDSSDDEADHGHDHGHNHGPRDVVIVAQRWALVTGACHGTGRAMVRALGDQGFSMVLCDSDSVLLASVAGETQRRLERGWRGGVWRKTHEMPKVICVVCSPFAVDEAVSKCEAQVVGLPAGALRLLVHGHGTAQAAPTLVAQQTASELDQLVRAQALLVMQLTRSLWPRLVESATDGRRAGLLFCVARTAATPAPAPFAAVHAATHAAVLAFAAALRAEAQGLKTPVDVLAVCHGDAFQDAPTPPSAAPAPSAPTAPAAPHTPDAADAAARAALLLLTTAQSASLSPLLTQAIVDTCQAWLPLSEVARARRAFDARAQQRVRTCAFGAGESSCCVCLEAFATASAAGRRALVPCGHVVCGKCVDSLQGQCPMCRGNVAQHVKVD